MSTQQDQLPPLEIPTGTIPAVADALRHWHEHRPRMYTELYSKGTLFDVVNNALDATIDDEEEICAQLVKQGVEPGTAFVTARQMVRERYIYLPTEEDVPELMTTESGLYTHQPDEAG